MASNRKSPAVSTGGLIFLPMTLGGIPLQNAKEAVQIS